jgi:ABC-type cobalamin/Fe3+-siderophores transport system ATPase subunit
LIRRFGGEQQWHPAQNRPVTATGNGKSNRMHAEDEPGEAELQPADGPAEPADESDTAESEADDADEAVDEATGTDEPDDEPDDEPLIVAIGLGVDGEHEPLFSDVDLELTRGLHAIQMPGGWGQTALLLTLAGRLKPTHGTVTVCGDTQPRAIRKHCSIAAFDDIDDLPDSVSMQTVLAEQRRWLAPWYSQVSDQAGAAELALVFGDVPTPSPKAFISDLSDLELFLLRVTLSLFSNRPILVVGDLEQVRDNTRRATAVERLAAIATQRTVVVGVTNPLGPDAPAHALHDHRILTGKD